MDNVEPKPTTFLGVSLKMYLDLEQTLAWSKRVSQIATIHPLIRQGKVELVVLPTALYIPSVAKLLEEVKVKVGAQDLYSADRGPFTGEISGHQLTDAGVSYVEIGHAERRTILGDDEHDIARKMQAAERNGLTPILCVGEENHESVDYAVKTCMDQVISSLKMTTESNNPPEAVIAYEPMWAIGAEQAAPDDYITQVINKLRAELDSEFLNWNPKIIYGGSAGPGLFERLSGNVDGLFLGRYAHDPDNLKKILDEVAAHLEPIANA